MEITIIFPFEECLVGNNLEHQIYTTLLCTQVEKFHSKLYHIVWCLRKSILNSKVLNFISASIDRYMSWHIYVDFRENILRLYNILSRTSLRSIILILISVLQAILLKFLGNWNSKVQSAFLLSSFRFSSFSYFLLLGINLHIIQCVKYDTS